MASRLFIVIVIVILGAVSTGAIVITPTEGSQTDTVEKIELAPLTGANGEYATVSNGRIELTLESLNDRAITAADDVFAITVDDDAVEQVWIENDVAGLTFYEGSDPTAEITESDPLEPSAGETIRVGVAVDTRVAREGTETFTVHARYGDDESGGSGGGSGESGGKPGDPGNGGSDGGDDSNDENETSEGVTLESLTVTPTTLEAGETLTVEATYRNEDSESKRHTAKLTVDGTVVDGRTIDIGPGETRTVAFEREMQWPGSYDVGSDGAASERVTVRGPAAEVTEATVNDVELTRGDRTTVSATIRNPTNRPVERTLEFAVDGIVVETRAVVVQPGSERTVSFDRQFDAPGTYELSVSGVDAGSVTVSEPDPLSIRNRELSAATTAALAPPLTMGILLLGAAANRRWAIVPTR